MTDQQKVVSPYKRIAAVTLPSLSRKNGRILHVYIATPLSRSESVDESDDAREPATTCRVLNLDDGRLYQYVASVVTVTALKRYPEGYVGRCFEIEHAAERAPGKQYYDVQVFEIEAPADLASKLALFNMPAPRKVRPVESA